MLDAFVVPGDGVRLVALLLLTLVDDPLEVGVVAPEVFLASNMATFSSKA